MPRFITIGYGDRAGYDATAQEVRDAAHAHDAAMTAAGALAGIAGTPVQVRNHDAGGVATEEGPFMSASLPVAGFGLIEADSLEDAVAMAAGAPCAVAQGVVEVWPLND